MSNKKFIIVTLALGIIGLSAMYVLTQLFCELLLLIFKL